MGNKSHPFSAESHVVSSQQSKTVWPFRFRRPIVIAIFVLSFVIQPRTYRALKFGGLARPWGEDFEPPPKPQNFLWAAYPRSDPTSEARTYTRARARVMGECACRLDLVCQPEGLTWGLLWPILVGTPTTRRGPTPKLRCE